jgi:hypothetical protein
MKVWYLFLVFIFIGFSCNREEKANRLSIRGQFSNSRNEKILLCEMGVKEIIPLDSARINNGNITFSHEIEQPGFYLLIFPSGKRLTLVMKKGEKLLITGDLMGPTSDFNLSGSEESQLLQTFFNATMKNKDRIDSIKRVLLMHEGSDDFLRFSMMADSLFSRVSGDQKKLEKEFIDQHPMSLASLIVLNFAFGPKPVLTMEEDLTYYLKLTSLFRIYPKNKHVLFHLARVRLFLNNLNHAK